MVFLGNFWANRFSCTLSWGPILNHVTGHSRKNCWQRKSERSELFAKDRPGSCASSTTPCRWLADWLAHCLTNWLTDWLTACLADWLTGWLTDWLAGGPPASRFHIQARARFLRHGSCRLNGETSVKNASWKPQSKRFWLPDRSRHNVVQILDHNLTRDLRVRRFSEPTIRPAGATKHWKNKVLRDFPGV